MPRMTNTADFRVATCPICGKEFGSYFDMWAYKDYRTKKDRSPTPVCSWGCVCESRRLAHNKEKSG